MLFNKKQEDGDYAAVAPIARPAEARPVHLNQSSQELRERAGSPARSVIDSWLTMTGNLESEGDIQVDGKVEGHIRCAQLIVGKDAAVNGDIIAEEVVVRGKVTGVIRANRVRLQDTAVVESEIFFHKSLSIEDGASFEGHIRRSQEATRSAAGETKVANGAAKPKASTANSRAAGDHTTAAS